MPRIPGKTKPTNPAHQRTNIPEQQSTIVDIIESRFKELYTATSESHLRTIAHDILVIISVAKMLHLMTEYDVEDYSDLVRKAYASQKTKFN